MRRGLTRVSAVIAAVVLAGTPVFASDFDPVGRWETVTGESRYDVNMCGDGTQLCAKVQWIRDKDQTAQNRKYIGSYLVKEARHSADSQWSGDVHVEGFTLDGTIKLTSSTTMVLSGCVFKVFCKSFDLKKISTRTDESASR